MAFNHIFDESLNHTSKRKQMDVHVLYFHEEKQRS